MLKILPSDAMLTASYGFTSKFYTHGDWFMAYEWFCRQLMEWKTDKRRCELLNETSSINNSEFDEIWNINAPCNRLAYLFKHGWFQEHRQPFLDHLKIKKWADLAKPIFIEGRRPKEFPKKEWFEMEGRTFSYSPNSSHPRAVWIERFGLQFCHYNKRWQAVLNYDYPHGGGSTWMVTLKQNYGEHLDSFSKRIETWLNEQLKPEDGNEAMIRQERERTWDRTYSAARDLFFDSNIDIPDWEKQLADQLVKIEGSSLTEGRMVMNSRRLATLKRWAKLKGRKHA